MLPKLQRLAPLILLIGGTCLAAAQSEEEDMNFAVAHMGMQLTRLLEGDATDRSATFPKNAYGEITKGMYQFVRFERIRVFQLDSRADLAALELVSALEWSSSPKAALRLISRTSSLYGAAKVAQLKELAKVTELGEAGPSDSPMLMNFKAGFRSSLSQKFGKNGTDSFTPFLIFLSKLEEVYHHIDQNKSDVEEFVGAFVFFKTERNNLIYEQKLDAMMASAEKLESQIVDQAGRLDEAMKKLKGLGKGSGNG